jgi:hypothetical protein
VTIEELFEIKTDSGIIPGISLGVNNLFLGINSSNKFDLSFFLTQGKKTGIILPISELENIDEVEKYLTQISMFPSSKSRYVTGIYYDPFFEREIDCEIELNEHNHFRYSTFEKRGDSTFFKRNERNLKLNENLLKNTNYFFSDTLSREKKIRRLRNEIINLGQYRS